LTKWESARPICWDYIPYVMGGKEKSLTLEPYPGIMIAMPGKHAKQTTPKGGDFVVTITDKNKGWSEHPFSHNDLFDDVSRRRFSSSSYDRDIMHYYLRVIRGTDPDSCLCTPGASIGGVMDRMTFLYAVQCLAVAEHRRYARFEPQFGGRYLPFRFSAGIDEGLWTPTQAADKQKKGRPGVEWLEKDYGVPALTSQLMGLDTTE
jgi:hypothetical protein